MDEQRKFAILFAATILAAQKLTEIGGKAPIPVVKQLADGLEKHKLRMDKLSS